MPSRPTCRRRHDTLAELRDGKPPQGTPTATVALDAGPVTIALRRLG